MAATIIAFPAKLLPRTSSTPLLPSQSAEEAAFDRSGFVVTLEVPAIDRPWEALSTPQLSTPDRAVALPAQVDLAVAQVDREISHHAARLRLLHLMIDRHSSTPDPA